MPPVTVRVTEAMGLDCKRAFFWGDILGYQSKQPAQALWFGILSHKALEAYYKYNRDPHRMQGALDNAYDESIDELAKEFPAVWDGMSQQYNDDYRLLEGMLRNYVERERTESLSEIDEILAAGSVLETEMSIAVPLPDPSGNPSGIFEIGHIDLVLQHRDQVWLVDHKNYKQKPGMGGLDVDDQLTGYCYLYWRKTGIIPAGVIYNVLIKRLPEEPRILKSGKLSSDKSQLTTYSKFVAKLTELGSDPSEYAEVLAALQAKGWSDYFWRDSASRNENELRAYERRLITRCSEILSIVQDPTTWAYPSPTTFRCSYCPFLAPCKAVDSGDDPWELLNGMMYRQPVIDTEGR